MADNYPSGIKVFIDNVDVTFGMFGADIISPNSALHIWRNINVSTFIDSPGYHTISITSNNDGLGSDDGRVEVRVKIR